MFSKKLLGTLVLIAAAVVVPGSATARGSERVRIPGTNTPTAPRPQRVQYGGRVHVGADGNGVAAARFATTLAGDDVRYVLVLDTDCTPTRCRPPVEQLDVNLNDALVLHATDLDTTARHEIVLNAIGADENQIVVTAGGSPGAGARVHILAVRMPRSPGARIHPLAFGATHSGARGDIDYIDDALGSGVRATTDRQH